MAETLRAFSGFECATFARLGVTLKPNELTQEHEGVLNPASARLRDGSLQLYPRMVAKGHVSRIGSFHARREYDHSLEIEQVGYALEPQAQYEIRSEPGGYGCEDPRVTFIAALDRYVMVYVAFGPQGPAVALAISADGLKWTRLGLMRFGDHAPLADKDAAFFPEPVVSPSGTWSLAMYHRPTLAVSIAEGQRALPKILALPPQEREGISIAYIPLAKVRANPVNLCLPAETYRLQLPDASWGTVKVGAGTPPVRFGDTFVSVIHGVDPLPHPTGAALLRYCAGIIMHDAEHVERVLYRSPEPLFVPEVDGEIAGTVGNVVFPTAIDPRPDGRSFDIYYGMADYQIGRGRITLV